MDVRFVIRDLISRSRKKRTERGKYEGMAKH